MKIKILGAAILLLAPAFTFAGSVIGSVKTIMTWDRNPAGDPWEKRFIFQIRPSSGATIELWSYTDNSVFFNSLLSASANKTSVTVEYEDSQNIVGGRKHATQVILGN